LSITHLHPIFQMTFLIKISILIFANHAVTNALKLNRDIVDEPSTDTHAPMCKFRQAEVNFAKPVGMSASEKDYCSTREWPHENKFHLEYWFTANETRLPYGLKPEMLELGWVPGNVFRMKKIAQKLRKQEVVEVRTLGGSFTRGHGCSEDSSEGRQTELACAWPVRAMKRLQTIFPKSPIHVQNMAEHGSGSAEILMRLGTLAKSGPIDLMIIDTLANDAMKKDDEAAGFEQLLRAITSHFPDTQLLIVEDGCPKCLKNEDALDLRRKIARHYGIPVMDYAAMVKAHNKDATGFDVLWPYSEPTYSGPYTQKGHPWPNFLPKVKVTSITCCAGNHPPWPVHEYVADSVVHAFHQMLEDVCGSHRSDVQDLPQPLHDQSKLDKFATCLEPLKFYDARTHLDGGVKAEPQFVAGDWELCEDMPGRPGWIATKKDSTMTFPISFGKKGVLSVTYLQSYENVGSASLKIENHPSHTRLNSDDMFSTQSVLHGNWDKHVSLPTTTTWLSNRLDGQNGNFLYSLAQKDNWKTMESNTTDYNLQVVFKGGNRFKIISVASC